MDQISSTSDQCGSQDQGRSFPHDYQRLTGQIVHARKCYRRLFFIDLRISDHEKCTVLFRSDDTREGLPRLLTDAELISCWKKIKRGDTIALEVFAASDEESAQRDHAVFQATDFAVLKAWPGDDPFPTEPAMGLKEESAISRSPVLTTPSSPSKEARKKDSDQQDEDRKADSWRDYCKFWISSRKCLKSDCRKRHPNGQEYVDVQEMWVKERTRARRERSMLHDDPHSMSSKVPHSQRAYIFCRWLVEKYGIEYLNSGSGVLDVAGGKGEISLFLTHMFGVRSTVVEPNMRRDKPYQRKNLMDVIQKQLDIEAGGDGDIYRRYTPTPAEPKDPQAYCDEQLVKSDDATPSNDPDLKEMRRLKKLRLAQFVVPRLYALLDEQFPLSYPGMIENASIIIGMHPDQATEPIVVMALQYDKPFAVVPCCVFANENRHRRLLNGGEVNTTIAFVEYLMEREAQSEPEKNLLTTSIPSISPTHSSHRQHISKKTRKEFLPFDGMNIVVYRLQ
ncbi:hypothetical protein BGX28_005359 [Mortierella sp. GBA30]|nr:hypothetical protein BGX28_005359 [Mortierella sp. GBA30]